MLSKLRVGTVFEIEGVVQNYAWGKIWMMARAKCVRDNRELTPPHDRMANQLWMGTHPSGPATVKGGGALLSDVLAHNSDRLLGHGLKDLPFLFKVLSVSKPLSIQAHPNKELAAHLHRSQPEHYKDSNHKPEMAIALTRFEALFGFRSVSEIAAHLKSYPELAQAAGEELAAQFVAAPAEDKVRGLLEAVLSAPADSIKRLLSALLTRIAASARGLDALLLRVHRHFPADVGVFCVLLLNHVTLSPGQALFMGANHLHAYLEGDCVEVMATSDNVVRAGLTPKYKDVETLVNMLRYTCGDPREGILDVAPHPQCEFTTVYDPPIPEFTVHRTVVPSGRSVPLPRVDGPRIMLVTEGSGGLRVRGDDAATGALALEPGCIWYGAPNVLVEVAAGREEDGQKSVVVYSAFYQPQQQ